MDLDYSSTAQPIDHVTPVETRLEQTVAASGTTAWTVWTARQGRALPVSVRSILIEHDRQRFLRFAEQWRQETFFSSSITNNLSHPAYLTIMAMGEKAVPLILQELQDRGGQWNMALRYIVDGEQYPDKPNDVGKPKELKEAWLAWGRQNNYL